MTDTVKLVVSTDDFDSPFEAKEGFVLKAIVGKHGELRVQTYNPTDVEQSEELGVTPISETIAIFAAGSWSSVIK